MKKTTALIFFVFLIFTCSMLCAGAVQDFNYEELSFSVPDLIENDSEWAQQQGFAYSFCDSEGKLELNVSVYENDGFAYNGLDQESLDNYASSLEDSFNQSGYATEDITISYYTASGVPEGINIKVKFVNGEEGDFYCFATETMCYDFEFFILDGAYEKYVEEIMETVVISPDEAEGDTFVSDVQTESDSAAGYEGILKAEGIELSFPTDYPLEFYDDYYSAYNCLLWCDASSDFELDFYIEPNVNGMSFYNCYDKTINDLVAESINTASQLGIAVTDSSVEEVVIGGKHGIKLSVTYTSNGRVVTEYDYYFSTADNVYSLLFYTYSEDADKVHQYIINSFSFEGECYTGFRIPEGKTGSKEYSFDGMTVALPEFMAEDSEWKTSEKLTEGWTSADALLQFGVLIESNKENGWVYTGLDEKDFRKIYEDQKVGLGEEYTKYELADYGNVEINGFEGTKILVNVEEDGCEYKEIHYYFSTEDTVYSIVIFSVTDEYDSYVEAIVGSIKIDGKPLKIPNTTIIYIIVAAVIGGISVLVNVIKKKKAKKNAAVFNDTPVYFNPQTDAYGNNYQNGIQQSAPVQDYSQQNTVGQNDYTGGNGYIENTGYAPDYDYSNKLDKTLSDTSDFSKTEYRRATADMEKKITFDEEE